MFKCGEKFSITNCNIDVEIVGFFPKSQSRDGKDYYVATLNGEKMKIASSFLEMLQKAQVKEETKFVDADLKVKTEPIIVKVQEEEKPKKERKNGRKRNAKA